MLKKLNLKKKLEDHDEYKRKVDEYELQLLTLERALAESGNRSVLVVFEGWEAAGRGECIKRITERLDPRGYVVYDASTSNDDERSHIWLWRFATKTPKRGQMVIFHRAWYTRVLDDRVEKRVNKQEIARAFNEINEFEKILSDDGTIIIKLWLHISKHEQKRRFEHFEKDPAQRWKVNADDWQEHRRYKQYEQAADEMVHKTDTAYAPWSLVEAEDSRYARVRAMEIVAERLGAELLKGGRK